MRDHVIALGLTLGLAFSAVPLATAEAARSEVRGPAAVRPAAARQTAIRQVSIRGGYSAMPAARHGGTLRQSRASRGGAGSYSFDGGISCVPYARSVTGMSISGNGRDWWYNAAGRYARASRPEPGAILSFPSSGAMRSGHVAVVSRVINARLIEIDHANWGGPGIRRGSVMQGVDVMDVSPSNDWTQVRVQVGHSNDQFGREYPTHGFILNRPEDGGAVYASYASGGYSQASFNRAPRVAARPVARQPALLHRASYQPARPHRR